MTLIASGGEALEGLTVVLDLLRSDQARTRPELVAASGLGRSVVAARVATLLNAGLVEEVGRGASTGGRAPRELRLRARAGVVLVVPLGAVTTVVGVTDLSGQLLASTREAGNIAAGPEVTLDRVEALLDELLTGLPDAGPVYGVGVGLPGPVEFASGRPVSPPIMPGWDGYDVRARLGRRFDAPVWVDNDVNLMALGELRAGVAVGQQEVVFLKVGTGIGAGLVSAGRLHRGAKGSAGDIGHVMVDEESDVVCRCGKIGCLEALVGGAALARDATAAARAGRSELLLARLSQREHLTAADVAEAARNADPVAVELIGRAGQLIGETVARIVNFFNPSLVVVGGAVSTSGDAFLATIRETVYRRSLPLATRELRMLRSSSTPEPGLAGAAHMVLDELFSHDHLGRWLPSGSPVGRLDLTASA